MKLTKEEVKHIAKLAELDLTDKEIDKYQQELSEILEYVKILDEVDTKNVKPISQVTGFSNIVRADEVGKSFTNKEALKNAKRTKDGYFEVEQVI